MTPIGDLVRKLRMEAAKAKRMRTEVTITLPAHIALIAANRLEVTEERAAAIAIAQAETERLTNSVTEALKDEVLRYQMAVTDLELLLLQFIGRPPMSMEEIRELRRQEEARLDGPRPFVRKYRRFSVSDELIRSVRSGRIGIPREPGEEG